MYARFFKRLLDIAVSLSLLILASPVFLLTALTVRLDSPGPVLFRQQRVGRFEQPFELLKFRTMFVDVQRSGDQTLPGDAQVTRTGAFLRRMKIDESAQLLNVLFGQMSLIGPRPCLPTLLDEMDDASRQRFAVRPGLSGLAQVNGNIYLEWPERWRYDLHYVKHLSLWMDVQILAKTVLVVLLGEARFTRRDKDASVP